MDVIIPDIPGSRLKGHGILAEEEFCKKLHRTGRQISEMSMKLQMIVAST